jgi:DNA polymerase I-like protein with 3'-5' exonuclease and polymerase domains
MTSANTGYVSSVAELKQVTGAVIDSGHPISLDCETGYEGDDRGYRNSSPSLHAEENLIAGYSVTTASGWARYVPVGHDETRYNIDAEASALALWRVCRTGRVIVHNADAEERWLSRWLHELLKDHPEFGAEVRASRGYFPLLSDTMMEAHALARWKSIALKAMSKAVFNYDQVELIELFNEVVYGTASKKLPKNKKNTLRFNVLDPSDPRVFNYACDDVIQTLRLHERHYPLAKDNFIYWLEMNVWPLVWAMEDEGLAFDWDFVDEARARARQFQIKMQAGMLSHLTERLDRVPLFNGKPFNPNSFPQLTTLLYSPRPEGLGLTTRRRTKGRADGSGKKMSTDATALKGLSNDPFVHRLQEYRGMTKLLSTYLENWRQEFGWCEDGRAHCHLLPHGAGTGRFSASDFNYQNLPKKYHYVVGAETFDFNFRNAVTVPDGWWGFGFDISQGELRIIAAEAGETAMLEAFERGEDLHALTASRLLHISLEEVYAGGELFGKTWAAEAGGFRPFGKTLNFALGYQLTVQGLADRLSCSVDEAQTAWDDYFAAYPAIATWTRRTVADSKLTGCTFSRLGRRHPIWAYESDKSWIYAGGERTAGNAPIQGGLADMMKLIMIRCHEALSQAGLLDVVRMVMNIHDALEFYVRADVDVQLVIDVLYPAIVKKTPWTEHWPVMEPEWHLWMRWGSPTELKLDENNQVIGLGGTIDIGEEEYEDDETPDDGSVPAVLAGPSGIAEAAYRLDSGRAPAGVDRSEFDDMGTGQSHAGRVIVKVPEMPEYAAVARFVSLLEEFPGPNTLELATPEGSVPLSSGTSLSPEDGAARIGMILGGAQVVWALESVDNDVLARGLGLLRRWGNAGNAGNRDGLQQGAVRYHAGRDGSAPAGE